MATPPSSQNVKLFQDFLRPFLINETNVKGKLVRLGEVVDAIISRHQYPEPVSRLLAELLVLAAMLSYNLKRDGILTVEIRGQGKIRLMVADALPSGDIRAYAELSDEGKAYFESQTGDQHSYDLQTLLNKGYLVITLDNGPGNLPYQGIVALEGHTLSEALTSYFCHSEQSEIAIKVTVGQVVSAGMGQHWCAGGIMVQRLPSEGGKALPASTEKREVILPENEINEETLLDEEEEKWNRSRILMESVQDHELLDLTLPPETILYRLFNEDGVWMFDGKPLHDKCRCSREKYERALASIAREELDTMKVDEKIFITCQFCSKTEYFNDHDLDRIYRSSPDE
jgi:molecular chaperone Hsp33